MSCCHLVSKSSLTLCDTMSYMWSFPDSSVGKESACNVGDSSSISGWGRVTGEGIGYPLQYSWASLGAQLAKNPPVMRKTGVRSLGWEAPLEKGKATHSSILAYRIPWNVYNPWGRKESDRTEQLSLSLFKLYVAHQTPSAMEFPSKILEWVAISFSRGFS